MRRIMGALAILLLTGCSTPVDGGAVGVAVDNEVTATTEADPVPWDPCTIPDSAAEAAGLDVATKESGIFGRDQNGFKICSWNDQPPEDWYSIALFSGFETLRWIEDDPATFDRLSPTAAGRRDAIQYHSIGSDASLDCGVAFEVRDTLIMATLITNPLVEAPLDDPCAQLIHTISALDLEIPS